MKSKIITIIEENPKRFSQMIKKDAVLWDWVSTHSLIKSDSISEIIYSAVHQYNPICSNGKSKKFISFSSGYGFCGHSNICKCNSKESAIKTSTAKLSYSSDRKLEIEQKRTSTMMDKYGSAYNSQRAEIKSILQKPKIPVDIFDKLNNIDWLDNEYNIKQRTLVDIARELNIYYGTVGEYCKIHNFTIRQRAAYSLIEVEITEFIRNLGVVVENSNWDILGNKEIDIYLPEYSIGIEVNGLYWHSFNPQSCKEENPIRHIQKTSSAAEKGITLLHITDYEWINNCDIVKSIIKSKLGLCTKIHARKCVVRAVDTKSEQEFIRNNHLQNYVSSEFAVGLYYNDMLISIMSIGRSRFDKSCSIELLRFCTRIDHTVVGGGSKLLAAIKSHYKTGKMVSYCDLSKSIGNSYRAMGFTCDTKKIQPGFFWTDGTNVLSRYKCQKQQLAKWLTSYDSTKSGANNMFAAGFRRYYDCGNQKWILEF